MARFVALCAALLCVCVAASASSDWVAEFLSQPNATSAREHLRYYTSLPHVAGTPGDYETAQYTLNAFKSYGLEAEIVPVDVLLSYPLSSSVEVVDPPEFRYVATLSEDVVSADPLTDDAARNHTFNGYGPSGDATGPLVYLNYGRYEDFEEAVKLGVNLTGAVGIVRYGAVFRGLKAKYAQEHGMVALIIYSDPADDGDVKGKTYPDGPWRPPSGIQRGSVQFNMYCAGDPGLVSRDSDICGGLQTDDLIPHIPVQPMGYGDAQKLLAGISGTASPSAWHGGVQGVSYDIGPGPAVVRVNVANNFTVGPIWNVIATIPGSDLEADSVLLGNHRDAWVYGAVDPNSGTAALLEVARGLGALVKAGWKPLRTVVLASWDGEEYGLLGSTGYSEMNAHDLRAHAVAYLNVDVGVCGSQFSPGGTPNFATVLGEVLARVNDPTSGRPLSETWNGQLYPLGSGSDYTAYLDHLGISSLDFSFGGNYGVYHSIYDSFHWMESFGDPTFEYHRAAAQVWGALAVRLSTDVVLPLNASAYAVALTGYIADLKKSAPPAAVNVTALEGAVGNLRAAADALMADAEKARQNPDSYRPEQLYLLNRKLGMFERAFVNQRGVPGRGYFKHVVYAPDSRNGYSASVFPGIVDAIRSGDATVIAEQVDALAASISAAIDSISRTE